MKKLRELYASVWIKKKYLTCPSQIKEGLFHLFFEKTKTAKMLEDFAFVAYLL